MDRRLGRPLPCQANQRGSIHGVTGGVYLQYKTRERIHRDIKDFIRRFCPRCFVRLACVKHAASVHPEPGSNSLNKCLLQVKINSWLIYPFYCFLRIFQSFVFMILKRTFEECVSLFSYQRSVLHCHLSQTALLLYHVVSCLSRTFFNFFEVVFVSLLQQL